MFVIVLLACLSVSMIFLCYKIGKKETIDYSFFDDEPKKSESHASTRYQNAD